MRRAMEGNPRSSPLLHRPAAPRARRRCEHACVHWQRPLPRKSCFLQRRARAHSATQALAKALELVSSVQRTPAAPADANAARCAVQTCLLGIPACQRVSHMQQEPATHSCHDERGKRPETTPRNADVRHRTAFHRRREQLLWERQQAMFDRVMAQWDAERQVRRGKAGAANRQRARSAALRWLAYCPGQGRGGQGGGGATGVLR